MNRMKYITEYADNPELWSESTMKIVDDHAKGSAHIFDSERDIDVTAYVHSYDYKRNGSVKTNHVPMVVVTDNSGSIREEPESHDSDNPETAIKRAIQTAEWAYNEYK